LLGFFVIYDVPNFRVRAYAYISRVDYFIFEFIQFPCDIDKIKAISTPIGRQFYQITLKMAKSKSKTLNQRNVGYEAGAVQLLYFIDNR